MKFAVNFLWVVLLCLIPACTKRQVGSATNDTYQYVAQGLCLTFVMEKVRKTLEPGSAAKDAPILSKEADGLFRARYQETSKAISEAKNAGDRQRLEKLQLGSLLDILRKQSPDLIQKCDRLAIGFRRCDKFQGARDKMRGCLERENKEPMDEILAFLNRDALAGFPAAR